MLEYEWGNPSPVILPENDDDPVHAHHHSDHAHHHQFFDPYSHAFNDGALFSPAAAGAFSHHHHHQAQQQAQQQAHFHPFYDPRYYASSSASFPPPPPPPPPQQAAMLGLDAASGGGGYMLVPKSEEDMSSQPPPPLDFTARLGLNLGGRTYFSAADEDFVSRLYRRSSSGRPGEASAGIGLGNSPRCQAEGCGTDLTHSKHYHRRHKVCEYHSKAASVVAAGMTQRFCQQCSRFHLLSEFDNGKRSCRKRLADHNRRRRKSQQQPNQDHPKPLELDSGGGRSSSSYGFARSPSESGGQYSSSSVTIAVSPPRMSLDSFRGRPYQGTSSAASSSSSIFFSSG